MEIDIGSIDQLDAIGQEGDGEDFDGEALIPGKVYDFTMQIFKKNPYTSESNFPKNRTIGAAYP